MDDVCAACLSSGRNLFFIRDTGFHHLYSQILNEMQVYDVMDLCIRVCWECSALLRKLHLFKQQVKQSYSELMLCAQNNTKPKPERQQLQVVQVHNYSFPQIQIKLEMDDVQHSYIEDRLDCIKTEDTHCEPETFVKDLVEPKRRKKETKKIEKTIKEKAKRKVTKKVKTPSKNKKSPIEKKIKVKIKPRLPSPASDNDLDAEDTLVDLYDEKSDAELEEKKNPVKDDNLKEETSRLNGAEASVLPEQLPERPHCVECGKNFSSRKTYRYHLNVLHKGQNRYPCPRCGKVYQWKSNLGRHLRSHKARDSGELYCETCDKRFASVATYRQHLRVSRRHVPESDFSFMCNECGKKFVNKTRLRDHIDWEHLKNIKFRCQLCHKPFKCHTSLYVHLQNVHRDKEKKDNLCHVCGKSYQNAAKLKYHIVAMHTSETPYQCQQCSAAFGWYSSLYRHVREVHYKIKVQPKKSKKTKKPDLLAPIVPPQLVLTQMHQGGQT